MRASRLVYAGAALWFSLVSRAHGQDLDPRAYVHVPVDSTFLVWGLGISEGGIVSDPTLPITDIQATRRHAVDGLGRSFGLFGKTAQAFAAVPYSWADLSGDVLGAAASTHRAGLSDMRLRLSWLAYGAPAATVVELARAPRRTIIGTSINVVVPVGEYSADRLMNLGTNRWSFRPEIALSQPIGERWLLDAYAGVSFFTDNTASYPGTLVKSQAPLGGFQTHLSYNFSRLSWAAFDMTYYVGGRVNVEGTEVGVRQSNVRAGATVVFPVRQRHSIKIAVSNGAIVRQGADFLSVSFAWQTAWVPRPAAAPVRP